MPKAGPKKHQHYPVEFKIKAVKLSHLDGVMVKDVAEALDIHPFMLGRWRREVRQGTLKARVTVAPAARKVKRSADEMDAFARLRRSHALLKEEHEILKKFIRFSSEQK